MSSVSSKPRATWRVPVNWTYTYWHGTSLAKFKFNWENPRAHMVLESHSATYTPERITRENKRGSLHHNFKPPPVLRAVSTLMYACKNGHSYNLLRYHVTKNHQQAAECHHHHSYNYRQQTNAHIQSALQSQVIMAPLYVALVTLVILLPAKCTWRVTELFEQSSQ